MRPVDSLLHVYGESHQNPVNKAVHWVCIPLIVFSLMGLLTAIPSGYLSGWLPAAVAPYLNWATLFLLVTIIYYVRLSLPIAGGMGLFAVGCIAGKKPSFFQDIQFLMVGPAWLIHFLYRKAGIGY
jgi:uncharacterized membrane protein YGL010W